MAQYMGLQDMDKGASRDMLKKLEAMGIETPEDLQRLFNRRAVDILGGQALSLGIDAFALTGCFTLHQYAGSLQQPFQFGLDAVSFGLGALFGSQLIGGLVALGASTTAALLFGANAEAFLEVVRERGSQDGSRAAKVLDAQRALQMYDTLRELSDELRQKSDDVAAVAEQDSYSNLAALLQVEEAMKSYNFKPGDYGLTEADAVRVARAFARYDQNRNGVLDPDEVETVITQQLGMELQEGDMTYVMNALDTNKDGKIEFNEFVQWFAGCPGNLCATDKNGMIEKSGI